MAPSVSYVVTLYNKVPYLPYLLAGLEAQSGDIGKEFIFVDDGSTDGTVRMLRDMTSGWKNVVVIEQANAGPASATNNGLKIAQGDYIKPVDGDDMLAPWATAYLLEALNATGCDVAFGDMGLQGRYASQRPVQEVMGSFKTGMADFAAEPDFLRKAFKNAQTNPTAWLAKRSLVEKTKGCDELIFIQDYSIELRLGYHGKVVRVRNELFKMPDAAPGRLSDQEAQILHDVNLALLRFIETHPDLAPDLAHYGVSRAASRAWAWARRHERANYFSKPFLLSIAAKLKLATPGSALQRAACEPFRNNTRLRIVDPSRAAA